MAKSPSSKTLSKFSQGKQQKTLTLSQVKRLTEKSPDNAKAWLQLGILHINANEAVPAREALEKACVLDDSVAEVHAWLATVHQIQDDIKATERHALRAVELDATNTQALTVLARLEQDRGRAGKALQWVEKAAIHAPDNQVVLLAKGRALFALGRIEQAKDTFSALVKKSPKNLHYLNDLGMAYRELGELDGAERCFREAMRHSDDAVPFANLVTSMHYDPRKSRDEIAEMCREWQIRYGVNNPPPRPVPKDLSPTRPLRIGMISDGFRQHPVGNMIIEALENISPKEMEFFFYSTSSTLDALNKRFYKLATHWVAIKYMGNEAVAQRVRDDKIDILLDLAGHNAGTRSRAVSMQPAPLIVKWVGGLINTTGVEAIDYLISDHIETPEGEDKHYTEKLIRLPDDYIVYSRPLLVPSLSTLPAKQNGYITLGCFNNPTKLNGELFDRWVEIMEQLPDSRLLLKGKPYTSEAFCERIYTHFEQAGINRERLILEGPAPHHKFLAAYNRVDISLDTWPYSGGLTTCESFLMGVPVVSLPGPTFAGRHSATHLVNAGMPELVVNSWDEYRERVLELASDLESLGTIRQHLRDVLLQSPVCDGLRFAKHLTMALRAIWQRYCEGKAPEALTFNKEGELWFEDDKQPLNISVQEKNTVLASAEATEEAFTWQLQGKLIAIDNGGRYLTQPAVQQMLTHKSLELIAFDPAGELNSDAAKNAEGVHYYPNALLGNGEPATLYACLDPAQTATLVPLEDAWLPASLRNGNKVLTQLSVNTLPLDKIDGLPTLDWLVLDDRHDASAILEHGIEALKETLLIDVGVAFQPSHERQPSLAELQHWASRNGFRFYRLNEPRHRSHLPEHVPAKKRQATELESANALFLPSHERMAELTDNQRTKLSFLLHTVYGIKDMAYALLKEVDEEKAKKYLSEEKLLTSSPKQLKQLKQKRIPKPEAETFPVPDAPFMTDAERQLFKQVLQQASRYFEFGSGGSTVWAVNENLTVKGVESDAKWVNALKEKLGEECQVDAVDIGPTKEWGYPVSTQQSSKFPAYSKAIHLHEEAFDLILVDGRFRVACTMAAIQHILEHSKKPQNARIFIHDFWNRPHYHAVLPFLETVEKVESAGLFKIAKNANKAEVAALWEQYAKQPQ